MLPTYIITNLQTEKKIAVTNAKMAYALYLELMKPDHEAECYAYSSFVSKVKKKPFSFLTYHIENVTRYSVGQVSDAELIGMLTGTG